MTKASLSVNDGLASANPGQRIRGSGGRVGGQDCAAARHERHTDRNLTRSTANGTLQSTTPRISGNNCDHGGEPASGARFNKAAFFRAPRLQETEPPRRTSQREMRREEGREMSSPVVVPAPAAMAVFGEGGPGLDPRLLLEASRIGRSGVKFEGEGVGDSSKNPRL